MHEWRPPAFLIFLDFDGVLHPVDAAPHEQFRPECIAIVNAILDQLDGRIVLSTAWRMDGGTDRFNAWFQHRILDSTPVQPLDLTRPHSRYREILSFLDDHQWRHRPWIAIDDKAGHFPDHAPAFITDRQVGLTHANGEAIVRMGRAMLYARNALAEHLPGDT